MRIGELSRKIGVNLQMIRFYERKGLLREPPRTPAGYREYAAADLEQVRFIRQCQQLGFTLSEIEQLSQLHATFAKLTQDDLLQSQDLRTLIAVTQRKLRAMETKIEWLQAMHQQLAAAVTGLEHRSAPVCPAAKREKKSA